VTLAAGGERTDTGRVFDERLGPHSTVVAALGLIPGLLVVAIYLDGLFINPGVSHNRLAVAAVFAAPPLAGFVLGKLNGYGPVRALALAAGALAALAVWWVVLLLPAVVLCSVANGNACT
jgi:hypothetical protein